MADNSHPNAEVHYIGIGGMAEAIGVSRQAIRNMELAGIVPPADRLDPGRRRIWRVADLEAIRAHVASHRANKRARSGPGRVA
ncbi:MAG: hypothetical protein M3Q71_15975 [Chloroflexota bacterium]|nr:hypothetical protein [Chloroflexota bacterium]